MQPPTAASSLPTLSGRRLAARLAALSLVMVIASTRPARAQGSWTIQTADPGSSSGWTTSLRLDAAGHPHVGEWMPGAGVRYAVFDGSSWFVETLPTPPSGATVGLAGARGSTPPNGPMADPARTALLITTATALALDPLGDPWLVYVTTDEHSSVAPSRPVHVSHKTGGIWTTEDLELGVRIPAVDVDGSGRVHVCYMGGTLASHELRYAVRDAGVWSYETVDPTGVRLL